MGYVARSDMIPRRFAVSFLVIEENVGIERTQKLSLV